MFKVGVVTNYFDKIGIAIIELQNLIAVGDRVQFVKDGHELFSDVIRYIQVGHAKLESAGRGQIIGIPTSESVEKNTDVFKM